MEERASHYPGDSASAADLLRLADRYRSAAGVLAPLGRPGDPGSRAPYRSVAIHAIELYLSALLMHAGVEGGRVRGMGHDLAARTDLAMSLGLRLRRKTADHLRNITGAREYLVSRYDPTALRSLSQLNRLSASLKEVAVKTSAAMHHDRGATRSPDNA